MKVLFVGGPLSGEVKDVPRMNRDYCYTNPEHTFSVLYRITGNVGYLRDSSFPDALEELADAIKPIKTEEFE